MIIVQGIAVSDVNESIAVAIDHVERIPSLRVNHLYLRAALLGVGAGCDQESERERDGDEDNGCGKLGCDCHSVTLRSRHTPHSVKLRYCSNLMGRDD